MNGNLRETGVFALLLALTFPVSGLTITDIGAGAPSGTTYSQPQHGLGGATPPNLTGGVGEELTLSASDPTTRLTDIYVKSSGQNSAGASADLDWTLNLYDLTTNHELTDSETGVSVTTGDYIDFTVSPTISAQSDMIGGDTYAFTITSSSSYFLAGISKSAETPPSFLPAGVTSEFGVTGNGAGNTLVVYGGGDSGTADVTYYVKTTAAPEPSPVSLMVLGAVALVAFGGFRQGRARV
jgi:hypothetical protein